MHLGLRHGRTRKAWTQVPTRAARRTRRAVRALTLHPQGNLRRRLHRPARHCTPVLHRGNERQSAPPPSQEDPRSAHHVHLQAALRHREAAGSGGTRLGDSSPTTRFSPRSETVPTVVVPLPVLHVRLTTAICSAMLASSSLLTAADQLTLLAPNQLRQPASARSL